MPDTPGTPGVPGDLGALRAENARLREANERLRLLNEDKDAKIADLTARNEELEERVAGVRPGLRRVPDPGRSCG